MKTFMKYLHSDVATGAGQPFVGWCQLPHQQVDLTKTVSMQGKQQVSLMIN